MKKFILTSIMTATLLSATAQCVPFAGSDFENWITINDSSINKVPYSYEKPDTTWMSISDLLDLTFTGVALPVINKSMDSYSGNYSMKMAADTGNTGNLIGQIFYTARPSMFSGYYKYNGSAGDSLVVAVGGVGDTINSVLLPPVANWTPFSVTINYNTSKVPDTFTVVFNLINNGTTIINTWLDDLCFGALSTAIPENSNSLNNTFSVYPNPAKDRLTINTASEKINSIRVFEITGKLIKTYRQHTSSVDIADLPKGLYLLQIQTDKGIGTKRFVKN